MSHPHPSADAPVPPTARPAHAGSRPPRLTEVPAFVEAIAHGWAEPDVAATIPPGAAEAAAAHRARLAERTQGNVVVVAAGSAPTRNDDCSYLFRPDSDFVWLTGCQLEDAVLVLRGEDATLYAPPPARPGDPGFFADAGHGELWVGASPDLGAWSRALGIDVRPLVELDDGLTRVAGANGGWAGRRVASDAVVRHGLESSAELARACADLRMVKDAWEVDQLRGAVTATVAGFEAVAGEIGRAVADGGERWLQGTFDRHARTVGNGPGYATIVGSGPHAPTLHWVRCDGPVLPDAALLLDMGVEARSLYTADVTRTLPPTGTFSPEQRAVHELVTAAHRAGLAQIRPGVSYLDFHFAAMEVLARGLHDWGLLPVSVDEALDPHGQHHRRWLVCGIGHHLGLDVHDCSASHWEDYMGADLVPGVVMTVEPGLYFHAHDLTVPPELRGIGVRLEDDLLVTPEGHEVLSAALPIDPLEVEEWTRRHAVAR